jgi:hypothetical protein
MHQRAVAPPPPPIDVVIAPQEIRRVDPVYPPAAVAAELEADVTLAGYRPPFTFRLDR